MECSATHGSHWETRARHEVTCQHGQKRLTRIWELCIINADLREEAPLAINYIERSLEPVLKQAAKDFPAVLLTGPRQSGKTTLLRHLFEDYAYMSLELPDVRASASADPRGFLDLNVPPVILDEVQHAPDLMVYIKERIDSRREARGQYILTGSQNLLLAGRISESLAGRTAVLRLLPLSHREARGTPQKPLPWERDAHADALTRSGCSNSGPGRVAGRNPAPVDLWKSFLRGYYPELVSEPARDPFLWHASYVQTYLERDVRALRQVGDLTLFQNFLRALAARSGQLLNLAELSRDLGISLNTVKAWLSVLEATYQVIVVRPYFANVGKRLVKTPKVYLTDVGTLCYLVGLKDPGHASAGPMAGAIMETAVLSEIVKTLLHRGMEPQAYFWRTSSGNEVDFVVANEGQLIPIEVKVSSTPRLAMAEGIAQFRQLLGEQCANGYVVHPGDACLPLGEDTLALPFARF